MTRLLLVLPIIIPLAAAALGLIAWKSRSAQRWLGVLSAAASTAAASMLIAAIAERGVQVTQIGNWPAPFGITLVADHFAALMVLVAAVIGLAVNLYSLANIDQEREHYGYYPLLQIMLMGVSAAFLTGDIFNLYVWFEVLLISSFVLLALGGERHQLEGAVKYVVLNLVSSFLFLIGVGLLYAAVGTLNMADAAQKLSELEDPRLAAMLPLLFFVAFGIKSAVFPLFFWLPASYHTPPVAVSAVFAGLLTKVGVYSLIRVFTLLFADDDFTRTLILVVSGLTMVTGVLGAVAQHELRRILSFHSISQIGYMIFGLGLFTPLGLTGSLFFILHHSVVKTNLFLVSGVVYALRGSAELEELGGLYRARPALAMLFAIPALSLAGIPPLSGFVAKLILVQAGLQTEEYALVAAALVVSLLTLYSMSKIWTSAFWRPAPQHASEATAPPPARRALLIAPVLLLAVLAAALGLLAEPIIDFAQSAAHELLDRSAYIDTVLGTSP